MCLHDYHMYGKRRKPNKIKSFKGLKKKNSMALIEHAFFCIPVKEQQSIFLASDRMLLSVGRSPLLYIYPLKIRFQSRSAASGPQTEVSQRSDRESKFPCNHHTCGQTFRSKVCPSTWADLCVLVTGHACPCQVLPAWLCLT